jgi:hypothetical protein
VPTAVPPIAGTEDAIGAIIRAYEALLADLRRDRDGLADRLRELGEEV